jgi:hypothetical protein
MSAHIVTNTGLGSDAGRRQTRPSTQNGHGILKPQTALLPTSPDSRVQLKCDGTLDAREGSEGETGEWSG